MIPFELELELPFILTNPEEVLFERELILKGAFVVDVLKEVKY